MKIIKKFVFIIYLLFLLPSCEYNNTHKRDYVETIYMDYEEDKFKLNVFIANVQDYAKNDEDGEADVLESSGSSIVEAIKLLENKLENNLDFHHTRTIVLQEGFYEEPDNIDQLVNTFYEYNAISRKSNIYTTTEEFDDLEDILKKDIYLDKLAFPSTIFDMLYNLGNYRYFIINNIVIEDESVTSKKGTLFIENNFITETDEKRSFGYFLLTGEGQEDIVLNSDFVVKEYRVDDDINIKGTKIYYTVDINIQGDYVNENFDKEETENYVYKELAESFDYFINLSYRIFNIEEEIYKKDYEVYVDFIDNKEKYKIIPKFNVEIINTEI